MSLGPRGAVRAARAWGEACCLTWRSWPASPSRVPSVGAFSTALGGQRPEHGSCPYRAPQPGPRQPFRRPARCHKPSSLVVAWRRRWSGSPSRCRRCALSRGSWTGRRHARRRHAHTAGDASAAVHGARRACSTRAGLVLIHPTSVPFAIFQLRGATPSPRIWRRPRGRRRHSLRHESVVCHNAGHRRDGAVRVLERVQQFIWPRPPGRRAQPGFSNAVGEHDAAWGAFAAGSILVSLPVMLLFYVVQKNLVAGLTAGGVKG